MGDSWGSPAARHPLSCSQNNAVWLIWVGLPIMPQPPQTPQHTPNPCHNPLSPLLLPTRGLSPALWMDALLPSTYPHLARLWSPLESQMAVKCNWIGCQESEINWNKVQKFEGKQVGTDRGAGCGPFVRAVDWFESLVGANTFPLSLPVSLLNHLECSC